ncbi:MAG: hypothetical protein ABI707_18730, partial [Ferruginibacter sp.]
MIMGSVAHPLQLPELIFHFNLNPMLVKTYGSAVYGVEAITIAVEVNINNQGKSDAIIVGLPDGAV